MTGKFARPTSGAFQSYLEYMDRDEAVRNEAYYEYSAFTSKEGTTAIYEGDDEESLEGYIHYMANPAKTSHLFSMESNHLDQEDIAELKRQFIQAGDNGSIMWQDVYSFDNNWLISHGYLDPETNKLDEKKIQNATRLGMNVMMEKEGMELSAIWTASIHYNTDNIHVHVATVEPEPTREMITFEDKETGEILTERKGYRSRKTIRAMKSAFSNQLMGLGEERAKIDSLNKKMIEGMRSEIGRAKLRQFDTLLMDVARKLPPQKGYQKYGYAERFGFKEPLDRAIDLFIENNFSEIAAEINERQAFISIEEEAAFGEGRTGVENKKKTLYTRLGNTILNEIQSMDLKTKSKQHARIDESDLENLMQQFAEISDAPDQMINEMAKDDMLMEVEDIAPEKTTLDEKSDAFTKALSKILANENINQPGEMPTQEKWLAYERSLELKKRKTISSKEDHYELLFNDQDFSAKKQLQNSKQKIIAEEHNRSEKRIGKKDEKQTSQSYKVSEKEWNERRRDWESKQNLQRQLMQLRRVLNDSTQEWLNKKAYQKMLNEIEYSQ